MADQLVEPPFDSIAQIDDDGTEFWSARDLRKALQYDTDAAFKKVIARAMRACEISGYELSEHFTEVKIWIQVSPDAKRQIQDTRLSRHACYMIVQSADPSKQAVAKAQTYLAIQTFRSMEAEDEIRRNNTEKRRNNIEKSKRADQKRLKAPKPNDSED